MGGSPQPLNIRPFKYPDDYPAAFQLWGDAGSGVHLSPSDTPEEIQKKLERDPDLFLVAVIEGQLIGTVIGGFDGRRGIVYHLVTHPDFRGEGVGSSLMEEVERRLKEKGCIRCYLMVTPDNDYAMSFYESRGWEKLNILPFAKNF